MNDREQVQATSGPWVALFIASAFASAFLIFLVQPMVGKRIIPWFGGAPGTWMVCLAFYQVTLFLGYAYAHGLMQLARPSIQFCTHALLVVAALCALPVLPGPHWAPEGPSAPITSILAMMTASVALPFLTLAATGPLVQAWFARIFPGRSPYPLYAVSNAGSLLGLIGYPFLIEPNLSLRLTGTLWAFAFAATGLGVLACALLAFRRGADPRQTPGSRESRDAALMSPHILLWLALSGTAVVILMGVTNKLCIDIASVPFLWALPLAVYLLTFILCFGFERSYHRVPYLAAAAAILLVLDSETGWLRDAAHSLQGQIALYCLLLFAACMVMHGELHRLRPAPRSLTIYYLCISGGGALGGTFVGILAPTLFDGFHELPLGIGLAWLLALAAWRVDAKGWLRSGSPRWHWLLVGGLSALVLLHSGREAFGRDDSLLYQERNFFGLLRVSESGEPKQHRLFNGTTLHGVQFRDRPADRRLGTSYYGSATGIAAALDPGRDREARRVGLVGLGVGTLAVYGREGDLFRFYEVDPAVIRLAADDDFFSFLGESQAAIEIVPGDARLSLMAEYRTGDAPGFDVLVLDAFSSASIPVHLLTREAFQIYDAALDQKGVIAVHISNHHFEIWPLIARLGRELGMLTLRVRTAPAPRYQSQYAVWCFLSHDKAKIQALIATAAERAKTMKIPPPVFVIVRPDTPLPENVQIWTDDYSDLFGLLRW